MVAEDLHKLLVEQMRVLLREFPDLELEKSGDGRFVVRGRIAFSVDTDKGTVEDAYEIDIFIPPGYPEGLPVAKEVGGRIPDGWHKHSDDHTLCLGAPLALRMAFAKHHSLLGYVRDELIPYLLSYSYWEQFAIMPHGELSHGGEGILEFYKEKFEEKRPLAVLGLLQILADKSYRGHYACPCDSGNKLRDCHGPMLLQVKNLQRPEEFLAEFTAILVYLNSEGDIRQFANVLPRGIIELLER
jgi:hypothetical protein